MVEFDDRDNKHVFLEEGELANFLIENIEEPGEKVKNVITGGELEGPAVFEIQVPSDLLGEEKLAYGRRPFTMYLKKHLQIGFSKK